MKSHTLLLAASLSLLLASLAGAAEKIAVLLIDGQNNHAWQETSPVLVEILNLSNRFEVEVTTTPPAPGKAPRKPKGNDPEQLAAYNEALKNLMEESEKLKIENKEKWDAWRPAFAGFDVVMSNYNGEPWPKEVEKAFEEFVKGGGGFVAVHAANNSHPQWMEYNKMIGLGGWGGRSEASGPYIRLRKGAFVKDETPGKGGAHGARHEFIVETRDPGHPIVAGLPPKWMHTQDELYGMLRGPAENLTVLATAFSDTGTGGSGEHEPILMVLRYGDGRVFHTTLGHDTTSMSGYGFQETLLRGTEWAATGEVTFPAVSAKDLSADKATFGPVNVPEKTAAARQ